MSFLERPSGLFLLRLFVDPPFSALKNDTCFFSFGEKHKLFYHCFTDKNCYPALLQAQSADIAFKNDYPMGPKTLRKQR